MNNKLIFVSSFKNISEEWKQLYDKTPDVSPFLHPDAMKIAIRYFYPYYISYKCRAIFAVYKEGSEVKAIVPLLKCHNGTFKLFGNVNGYNECGLVYDGEHSLDKCIQMLKREADLIEIARVNERNKLSQYAPGDAKKTINVAIKFGDCYEDYFKTLSASVRQNIRTAYNRLGKDGFVFEIQHFKNGHAISGNKLPIKEIIDLYCSRHSERYGVKTSWLKKWFLKHQNFATMLYRYSSNAMTFYLKIDGRPAAFLSGLYTKERLIVPRLSINDEFRRYSPGIILVCETIKHLISDTSIRTLDLSQGEEEYKYKLGGRQHLAYSFNL